MGRLAWSHGLSGTLTIDRPERLANWRPILHVIFAIPHFAMLHTVLNVAASVTAIVAWLTVLSNGNAPPGIAPFHATYVRYRTRPFSHMFFLTDTFPPFRRGDRRRERRHRRGNARSLLPVFVRG